jgi:hypothetical protein
VRGNGAGRRVPGFGEETPGSATYASTRKRNLPMLLRLFRSCADLQLSACCTVRPGGNQVSQRLHSIHAVHHDLWRVVMNPSAMTLVVCIALGLGVTSAHASPCGDEIAQLEKAARQSESNPAAGPTASQSIGAQLRHQPTPESVMRRSRFKSGPRRDLDPRQSLGRRRQDRGVHGVGWHRQAQARMSVAGKDVASHRHPSCSGALKTPDRNSLICRCSEV